jgi:hypothetical protein
MRGDRLGRAWNGAHAKIDDRPVLHPEETHIGSLGRDRTAREQRPTAERILDEMVDIVASALVRRGRQLVLELLGLTPLESPCPGA